MAIQTGLEGKPWYVSAGVAAGLAIGIIVGVQFTMISPMKDQIQRERNELDQLDRKIHEGRTAEKSLPQFREEVGRLSLELEKLLKVLPAQRKTQDLLRRIRTLTEQGDFTLLSFSPRRRSEREFYYIWPIQVRLVGAYHNLALFFDRVSRFSRIINVEELDIRAQPGAGTQSISATFTMTTYLYIDRNEGGEE